MKLSIAQINYPPGLVFGFKKKKHARQQQYILYKLYTINNL